LIGKVLFGANLKKPGQKKAGGEMRKKRGDS